MSAEQNAIALSDEPRSAAGLIDKIRGSSTFNIITGIFLLLVFALSIANAVFYIRIYNQSKDRDQGTGIEGLTVTGSIFIAVISIIIGIIALFWGIWTFFKNKDLNDKVSSFLSERFNLVMFKRKEKMMAAAAQQQQQAMVSNTLSACSAAGVDTDKLPVIAAALQGFNPQVGQAKMPMMPMQAMQPPVQTMSNPMPSMTNFNGFGNGEININPGGSVDLYGLGSSMTPLSMNAY